MITMEELQGYPVADDKEIRDAHNKAVSLIEHNVDEFFDCFPGAETVKLSKNFDNNGMNVTVKNNSSDSLTIKVLVGVYNENDTLNTAKLQTVTLDSKAEQTISFAGITSDKSVSIFAWDKDMTPLTNVLQ